MSNTNSFRVVTYISLNLATNFFILLKFGDTLLAKHKAHKMHKHAYKTPGYFPDQAGLDLRYNFNAHGKKTAHAQMPSSRTSEPIVTGTSVIAVKYQGGVVMAADTLASYGSLARFYLVERMKKVGDWTAVGGSGEYSDFQYIGKMLDELITEDFCRDDGRKLHPEEIYNYLCRVMYSRRNKGDPYWNSLVVAGYRAGKSFLGYVDLQGTCYEDDFVTTGYGSHLALPLIRPAWRPDLTKEEATKLVTDCMRVLYYRDARSSNKIQVTTIDDSGVSITAPFELATYNWDSGELAIRGDKY
jgi:20S proteasome subunit beta 7